MLAVADIERVLADNGGQKDAAFAVGEPGAGVDGWRLTHRQAQAALLVALRRPGGPRLTRYVDVALLASALRDDVLTSSLRDLVSRRKSALQLGTITANRTKRGRWRRLGMARHGRSRKCPALPKPDSQNWQRYRVLRLRLARRLGRRWAKPKRVLGLRSSSGGTVRHGRSRKLRVLSAPDIHLYRASHARRLQRARR